MSDSQRTDQLGQDAQGSGKSQGRSEGPEDTKTLATNRPTGERREVTGAGRTPAGLYGNEQGGGG